MLSRPEVAARLREGGAYALLGGWPSAGKLPVVYSPLYNISFLGIENLHPFDSKKYKRVSQCAATAARSLVSFTAFRRQACTLCPRTHRRSRWEAQPPTRGACTPTRKCTKSMRKSG